MKAAVILIIALLPGETASSEAASTSAEVVVHFDDLNLSAPRGQASLRQRIKAAARVACGIQPDIKTASFGLYKRCLEQAVQGAVAAVQVTHPQFVDDGK